MESASIAAYDLPERVAAYDADMEIMHPNRSKMVAVALEVMPFSTSAALTALDLGVGTGFFSQRLLERFSAARVTALDGATAMLDLARARLGPLAERVRFVRGDFRRLGELVDEPADVVYSSYALHHLDAGEKEAVIRQALGLLKPGGWFLNADLVVAQRPEVERRIQELRVAGIVGRAGGTDPRFRDAPSTRAFLDDLEARDGDQPQTLTSDLDAARRAGLASVELFWREHREVVWGGPARSDQ